jgi:rhodanese-related sulfurtransferase
MAKKQNFFNILLILYFIFFSKKVNAFLPPEFFVQGLSSIWMVVAGGVAVALAPFVLFFKFIKIKFRVHKKIIIFILIQNIILASVVGVFFYYKFYKPLYDDSYLFPQGREVQANDSYLFGDITDPAFFNEDYVVENGYYRDKHGNRTTENRGYGIAYGEVVEKIESGENIKFIDVREVEEYNVGHIEGAKHYRVMDITIEGIKKIFNLSEGDFNKGTFILVCHDGGRGLLKAKELDRINIKYLIAGIESLNNVNESEYIKLTGPVFADYEIFDKKYQTKYQTQAEDIIKMINKNEDVLIIDGRHISYYEKKHIQGSIHLKIGHMTIGEYQEALSRILDKKGFNIVILPDRYSELFYANLLLLRLERDYNLDDNKFFIVFNQFIEFEKDSEIEFEGNSV